MRVPLEILRLILGHAERDFSLKHLFALRLVCRLFENEVLLRTLEASRLRRLFSKGSTFHGFPPRLKRKYLYFRLQQHQRGHASVFSTLFYRVLSLQLQRRGAKDDESNLLAKEILTRELVEEVDLDLFTNNCFNKQWCFFIQGPDMKDWLREHDTLFPNAYPDVNVALTLYVLCLVLTSGNIYLADNIKALLAIPRAPQYNFAFTHDVLKAASSMRTLWYFKIVYAGLVEYAQHLSSKPYIEEAVRKRRQGRRFDKDMADIILRQPMGDSVMGMPLSPRSHQALWLIGDAMRVAHDAGEVEVSAIIYEKLRRIRSDYDIHAAFYAIYGHYHTYHGRRPVVLSLSASRMQVIQVEAQLMLQAAPRGIPKKGVGG